jgi:hypothetical protein
MKTIKTIKELAGKLKTNYYIHKSCPGEYHIIDIRYFSHPDTLVVGNITKVLEYANTHPELFI